MIIISLKEVTHSQQHEYAHKLLEACLNKTGVPANTEFSFGKYGKPYIFDSEVYFNLSHATGISACCVYKNECGIDAEKIREYRPNVVKRVFSEKESAAFELANEEEKNVIFFKLWTLKESYVKAIGIGVSYPLNTVEFQFNGEKIITNIVGYAFKQYVIDNTFVVSICKKME